MPNATQAELASVYVRYTDVTDHGDNTEESIKDNQSFDLVLELEAGQVLFNQGSKYNLSVVLNDLFDSSKTIYSNTQGGALGDSNWLKPDVKFAWTIPAGTLPLVDNHVYQAIGVLSVGNADPIVDMEQSELFVVTQA